MSGASLLPDGFFVLEAFVADWAVAGSAYLDAFPVDALDERQQRLLDLMLMLAHVALAVEKQGANEAVHAINHAHFTITRSTEDA